VKELEPAELLGREGALRTSAAAHLENGRDDGSTSTCRPGGPRRAYLATGRSTNDEAPVHQLGVGLLLVAAHGLLRKEVIQPHLPVRLPCYDFTPIADPTFDSSLPKGWATGFGCYRLSWCDGRCVQGPGTYSPRRS
jgi:hypothetical protein